MLRSTPFSSTLLLILCYFLLVVSSDVVLSKKVSAVAIASSIVGYDTTFQPGSGVCNVVVLTRSLQLYEYICTYDTPGGGSRARGPSSSQ